MNWRNSWHNRCGYCDQRCESGSALAAHEATCESRMKEREEQAIIAAREAERNGRQ